MEADLQILQDDRIKYHNNPLLGYLKINSLRNKVTDLRIIFKDLSLDYFVLSEAKLDESFPTAQFTSEGYETRRVLEAFTASLYLMLNMNTSETLFFHPLLLSGISSMIIFEIRNRLVLLKNKSLNLSDQVV